MNRFEAVLAQRPMGMKRWAVQLTFPAFSPTLLCMGEQVTPFNAPEVVARVGAGLPVLPPPSGV